VLGEPEDDLDVGPVPTVSEMVCEEAPGVVVVFLGKEDAHAVLVNGPGVVVVSPDETEEERSSGGHDGDVGKRPAAVVVRQRVDSLEEEGVTRDSAHGIVGDTSGNGTANPGWIGEERIETSVASLKMLVSQRLRGEVVVHRPSQCRFHQSGAGQSIGWHRRAGWGMGSRRRSRGTMGI
jgi:hypothetical protein